MRIAVAGGTGTIGRHVVATARGRGHHTTVLARTTGTDLYAGAGIDERLSGVDVVIDATSAAALSASRSIDFFRTVTQHLITAGRRQGVRHHVAISIIGARQAPFGYYAGKQVQEDLVLGQDNGTVVRSAQFHEFATQTLTRTRVGPVHAVPVMRSQPVSAAEVASHVLDVALGAPRGEAPEIAGPQELLVAELIRQVLRHRGSRTHVVEVPMPGGFGRAMRDGMLLPGPEALLGRQTFSEWLAGQDR